MIAGLDEAGEQLGWVRIDNDPQVLVREVRKAGGRGAGQLGIAKRYRKKAPLT